MRRIAVRDATKEGKIGFPLVWLTLATIVAQSQLGCGETNSSTALVSAGPPMVRQIFMQEKIAIGDNFKLDTGLAYGDHTDIPADDDRVVDRAVATEKQIMRVVFDELLKGNAFEVVPCADGGAPSVVSDDTTPDDLRKCSKSINPTLDGCTKVCLRDTGPVGILDIIPAGGGDGAPDTLNLRDYDPAPDQKMEFPLDPSKDGVDYAFSVLCDNEEMPIADFNSDGDRVTYYNPSGNQLIPAGVIGINGLGPALKIQMLGMKTNATCTIKFKADVVDHDGIQVCATEGGDPEKPCTPGDTSAITWKTEPLAVAESDLGSEEIILTFDGVRLDPATADEAVTVKKDGVPMPGITVEVTADDASLMLVHLGEPVDPAATYEVSITTALTDIFGGALPEPVTLSFP